MADRPSDHLQPAGKRRAGAQMTKDDASDDSEGQPDPGTWGPSSKADEATLARRKIIRARRGPGGAPAAQPDPPAAAPAAAAGAEEAPADGGAGDVAPSNPFAGRSLLGGAPTSNPFAGVSLSAAAAKQAKPAEDETAVEQPAASKAAAEPAASAAAAAAAAPGADKKAAGETSKDGQPATAAPGPAADAGQSATVFGSAGGGGFGAFAGGGFGGSSGGFGGFVGSSGGGFGGFGGSSTANSSLFGFGAAATGGAGSKPLFGTSAGDKDGEGSQDGDAGEGGDGGEVFGGPEAAPVVTLEVVPKVTGEEREEVLFTADGALFEFDAAGRSWHERGRGEFRVNRDPDTRAARAVMRERASKRLILNARLYATMPTSRMAPPQKGVTFAVVNVAPSHAGGDGAVAVGGAAASDSADKPAAGAGDQSGLATYALRLKSAEAVDTLLSVVDAWKAEAKQQPGGAEDDAAANGEAAV